MCLKKGQKEKKKAKKNKRVIKQVCFTKHYAFIDKDNQNEQLLNSFQKPVLN